MPSHGKRTSLGVSILKLLEIESQQGPASHRRVIEQIRQQILRGETLQQAFQNAGNYFPALLTQMIGAGEQSGGLDRIFSYMADHYRDIRAARRQFIQQITGAYPTRYGHRRCLSGDLCPRHVRDPRSDRCLLRFVGARVGWCARCRDLLEG